MKKTTINLAILILAMMMILSSCNVSAEKAKKRITSFEGEIPEENKVALKELSELEEFDAQYDAEAIEKECKDNGLDFLSDEQLSVFCLLKGICKIWDASDMESAISAKQIPYPYVTVTTDDGNEYVMTNVSYDSFMDFMSSAYLTPLNDGDISWAFNVEGRLCVSLWLAIRSPEENFRYALVESTDEQVVFTETYTTVDGEYRTEEWDVVHTRTLVSTDDGWKYIMGTVVQGERRPITEATETVQEA